MRRPRAAATNPVAHAPADPRGPPETGDAGPAGVRIDSLWPLVERVIAPTTLLVALTYYFGWQYTQARTAYLGVDVTLLDFSTQDYVTRSADALFVPLGALALAGLACIEMNAFACRAVDRAPRSKKVMWAIRGLRIAGALLLAVGVYGAIWQLPVRPRALWTLTPAAGILLIAFAARLAQRRAHARGRVPPVDMTRKVLVAAVVAMSLFWTVSDYATHLGKRRSAELADALERRPGVIVFSRDRLMLAGPGVHEKPIADPRSLYRYRYWGLRLLSRSGGRYFFLPADWTREEGDVFTLSDSEQLRFEFAAPERSGDS